MPKDDTTIRRYNELKTRQMAIKKKWAKRTSRQENKQKATKNDKAPKDLIDQEF
jgi:hypothetical protein